MMPDLCWQLGFRKTNWFVNQLVLWSLGLACAANAQDELAPDEWGAFGNLLVASAQVKAFWQFEKPRILCFEFA